MNAMNKVKTLTVGLVASFATAAVAAPTIEGACKNFNNTLIPQLKAANINSVTATVEGPSNVYSLDGNVCQIRVDGNDVYTFDHNDISAIVSGRGPVLEEAMINTIKFFLSKDDAAKIQKLNLRTPGQL